MHALPTESLLSISSGTLNRTFYVGLTTLEHSDMSLERVINTLHSMVLASLSYPLFTFWHYLRIGRKDPLIDNLESQDFAFDSKHYPCRVNTSNFRHPFLKTVHLKRMIYHFPFDGLNF
jgi:hypothetical protein